MEIPGHFSTEIDNRRPGRDRHAAEGSRHRHGLPVLRALSAYDRFRQYRLRHENQAVGQERDRHASPQRRGPVADRIASGPFAQGSFGGPASAGRARSRIGPPPGGLSHGRATVEFDAKLRIEARSFLAKMHHEIGVTTVYVTHDQSEAMTMGDTIVVMKDGLIQQSASPLIVYNQPANVFVAGFIGSPAMNFLELSLAGSKVDRSRQRPRHRDPGQVARSTGRLWKAKGDARRAARGPAPGCARRHFVRSPALLDRRGATPRT